MANTPDNRLQQRPQHAASAATGWIIGVIIAVLAAAALWFYGFRGGELSTPPSAPTGTVTPETPAPGKEAPPTTAEPGTTTGGSTSTPAAPSTTPAPSTP